jgi:hypothetical protein
MSFNIMAFATISLLIIMSFDIMPQDMLSFDREARKE